MDSPSLPAQPGDDRKRRGISWHRIRWGRVVQDVLLGLVVLGMIWLAFHVRLPSLDGLREVLDARGAAAWAVFILLYALVAVTPIPGQVSLVAIGAFIVEPDTLTGVIVLIAWAVVITMTVFAYRNVRGQQRGDRGTTHTGR